MSTRILLQMILDCAELIYQFSAVHISQIFATIILWYQQAFLGTQVMKAQFAGLKEAKPLTQTAIKLQSDAATHFCILLQPCNFLQTFNFSFCTAVVLHLGIHIRGPRGFRCTWSTLSPRAGRKTGCLFHWQPVVSHSQKSFFLTSKRLTCK